MYDIYLYSLVIIKLLFVFSVIQNKLYPSDKVKHRIDNLDNGFKVGVSLLIIYLFRPSSTRQIDNKTKIILLTFAVLTVFDIFHSFL
jgi:hypothetical protein